MSNYQIKSITPLSNSEAQSIIKEKIAEREPTYREEKIKTHLKNFTKLNKTNFTKAKKEIQELNIPRLEEEQIIKILDITPQNGTELRSIVSNTGTVLVDNSVKQILDVLKKYQK